MATQAELRQRVFDNLFSAHPGERPFVQLINGAVADGTTTSITVDDGTYFDAGDIIEFDDGEQCYVLSVATNTLTVIRGFNGTTGAAHADNSVIRKNPRITIKQVDDAMNSILYELDSYGLFQVTHTSITLVAGQDTYELSAITQGTYVAYPGVISVYYLDDDGNDVPLPFHTVNLVSDSVHTYPAVRVLWWGDNSAGDSLYVTVAEKYDALTELPTNLEEVLVLGATSRTIGKLIAPLLMDPGQHSNRTVPAGQPARDSRWYTAEYMTLARREAANLRASLRDVPSSHFLRRSRRFQ